MGDENTQFGIQNTSTGKIVFLNYLDEICQDACSATAVGNTVAFDAPASP
jgi:hypothetical protein